MRTAALSHRGLRRKNNEDAYLARPDSNLLLVCDGMGGHEYGEVASRLAVETIHRELEERGLVGDPDVPVDIAVDGIRQAIATAHARIRAESQRLEVDPCMGTTAVVALILSRVAVIASVGDSRCYLIRQGLSRQLTRDHTVVQQYMDLGLLSPEQARGHRLRHVLSRVLGGQRNDPDLLVVRLQPDDRLLLCSDGLNEMVTDAELERLTSADEGLDRTAASLVQRTLEAGGFDNVTLVLFEHPGGARERQAGEAPRRRPDPGQQPGFEQAGSLRA